MAKNKNRKNLSARNSATPNIENQAVITTELTAQNALVQAMACNTWSSYNYNQPLSSANAYNNISLELLSLQQIVLTYLYKTFGILGKVVDIPVDDAYKNNGFELNADSVDENELKELYDELITNQDIENLKMYNSGSYLIEVCL